jgi:hypothetical protein
MTGTRPGELRIDGSQTKQMKGDAGTARLRCCSRAETSIRIGRSDNRRQYFPELRALGAVLQRDRPAVGISRPAGANRIRGVAQGQTGAACDHFGQPPR